MLIRKSSGCFLAASFFASTLMLSDQAFARLKISPKPSPSSPQAAVSSIQSAAIRQFQEWFARFLSGKVDDIPGYVLGYFRQRQEKQALEKVLRMPPGPVKDALLVFLNKNLRGNVKFPVSVAGIPPETLEFMYMAGDFCILHPKSCLDQAAKQASIYSQKRAKAAISTPEYLHDCILSRYNESKRLLFLADREKACDLIKTLASTP